MKKLSKLTALLLALSMLISMLPVSALATTISMSEYQTLVQTRQAALTATETFPEPIIDMGGQVIVEPSTFVPTTTGPQYTEEYDVQLGAYAEGAAPSTAISLNQYGKVNLVAPSAGQWQVYLSAADMWVNVSGETGDTFALTFATVQGMFIADGSAMLRCMMGDTTTETVNVGLSYDAAVLPANVEEDTASQSNTALATSTYDLTNTADEPSTDTVIVEVAYRFETTGETAAQSYIAQIAKGSDLTSAVINLPVVQGYVASRVDNTTGATFVAPGEGTTGSIQLQLTDVEENITYTVYYIADYVSFEVNHYHQNVDDDDYTLKESESITSKKTGEDVGTGLENSYSGFTSVWYDSTTKVAADGSTYIDIYYNRNYYLMKFDLDGGWGVEPIYARYGTVLAIGEPQKPGYTFVGWDETIPSTMPAENTTFTAVWTTGDAQFTIAFWYENANDNEYSTVGSATMTATAGSQVSSETYRSVDFEGRDDDHFTYNEERAETVAVAGDGSTVLNVYFTRNKYTLTFDLRGQYRESDKDDYEEVDNNTFTRQMQFTIDGETFSDEYSFDAKFEQDITNLWPTAENVTQNPRRNNRDYYLTSWYWEIGESNGNISTVQTTLTATLIERAEAGEFLARWRPDTVPYELHYMLQTLDNTGIEYNGIYVEDDSDLHQYVYYTNAGFNYKQLTGFTYHSEVDEGIDKEDDYNDEDGDGYRDIYFYYTRNQHQLTYFNQGTELEEYEKTLYYEQVIDSSYNITPPLPSGLEEGGYAFEGWYTSPFFGDTKVAFGTDTMPDHSVPLYANWEKISHEVKVYLTSDKTTQLGTTQTVLHNELAVEPDEDDVVNGQYQFVGWFYMDGTTEKAFDFESMQIKKNMEIYAKWTTNTPVDYTFYYRYTDANGNVIDIGEATSGQALHGQTVTLEAKTGTDLLENYQTGYFPVKSSHSLTVNIDDADKTDGNTYVFEYEYGPTVEYTVRYVLVDENGNEVRELAESVTKETANAVVTENYLVIAGYLPDEFQKRLVVTYGDENVIVFKYAINHEEAIYTTKHFIQNIDNDNYSQTGATTSETGDIGTEYSKSPLSMDGFTFSHALIITTEVENDVVQDPVTSDRITDPTAIKEELPGGGMEFQLYYNRNPYPYKVVYLEEGTNKVLAPEKTTDAYGDTLMAKYGANVGESALDISGYKLVGSDRKSLIIDIETEKDTDGELIATKNVITFYYVEQEVTINYVVVGPEGCGTVTPESETLKALTGVAEGSTALPTSNTYKFVGWYATADCSGTALEIDPEYVPTKDAAELWVDGTTYYAKFEMNVSTLTISKSGMESGETAIFTVKATTEDKVERTFTITVVNDKSVTIPNLIIGTSYTVTEKTDWTWRYTSTMTADGAEGGAGTIQSTGSKVECTNTSSTDKWLDAEYGVHNDWANPGEGTKIQ